MRKTSALGAAVALLVLLAVSGADVAFSSSLLRAVVVSPSTSAISASWSVAAVATPSASLPALTGWTNAQYVSSKSFYLKNFGSLTTVQFTITLTTGATTSTLQRCSLFGVGVSPGTNTACSGGSWVSMLTASSGDEEEGEGDNKGDNKGDDEEEGEGTGPASAFSVVSIALPANSWLFVRVLDSQSNKSDSISVSITNTGPIAGIRAATTINS